MRFYNITVKRYLLSVDAFQPFLRFYNHYVFGANEKHVDGFQPFLRFYIPETTAMADVRK